MTNREKKTKSEYILRWAKKLKAVNLLGGECIYCKSSDFRVLEFHHPNDNKEHNINDILGVNWNEMKKEVEKCVLLCCRCHSIEHSSKETLYLNPRNNKKFLLEYIGKKQCEECNWTGHQCALEFHHKNPLEKEIEISDIRIVLKTVDDLEKKIIGEINKCQVLCSNCHQLKHISDKFILYEKEIKEKSEIIKNYNVLDHNKIILLHSKGLSMGKLAKKFNTSKSSISYIINKN